LRRREALLGRRCFFSPSPPSPCADSSNRSAVGDLAEAYDSYLVYDGRAFGGFSCGCGRRVCARACRRAAAGRLPFGTRASCSETADSTCGHVFRLPEYGALVRGAGTIVQRQEPMRRIDAPFVREATDRSSSSGSRRPDRSPGADGCPDFGRGEVSYVH
jgi:hypothetical protein